MTDDAPKRRGRPPMADADKKSGNLTFRTRGSLRSMLEDAATDSGRSVSEEIEHRLELSFERKAVALEIYGKNNTNLVRALHYLLSTPDTAGSFANPNIYLAAITTLLAASNSNLTNLIEKNLDPSVWLFLSQQGISRACEIDMQEAANRAEQLLPEMALKMSEYRAGVDAARRVKKAKVK